MSEAALYLRDGAGFRATEYTRGPWDPGHQHAGPPTALLARAAARASGMPEGRFARVTVDILGPLPIARVEVAARVVRPGRRVELLEARLTAGGGEPLMRLTAWRIRAEAVALPDGLTRPQPPPPGPDDRPQEDLPFFRHEIGYHRALEWRSIHGTFAEPGPAAVWARLAVPLVAGESPAPVERLLVMADAASGVSAALDWSAYTFVNVDFGVHLEREPEGEWTAMDAVTRPGPLGAGQCVGVLSDVRGRVGVSTQSLIIATR